MNVLEQFISVNASPADVERHLTTQALAEQWVSSLVVLEPIEGEWMKPGSKYLLRLKTLGLFIIARYTVVERDSEHILLSFEGPLNGTNLWRWFKRDNQTIVQNRIEYEVPNAALRVFIDNIGALLTQIDMRVQISTLQQVVEGRGPQQLAAQQQIATQPQSTRQSGE